MLNNAKFRNILRKFHDADLDLTRVERFVLTHFGIMQDRRDCLRQTPCVVLSLIHARRPRKFQQNNALREDIKY